jgi:hypothetical protein
LIVELLACVVVLKSYEMSLRGAECTSCCAVRSTTVVHHSNYSSQKRKKNPIWSSLSLTVTRQYGSLKTQHNFKIHHRTIIYGMWVNLYLFLLTYLSEMSSQSYIPTSFLDTENAPRPTDMWSCDEEENSDAAVGKQTLAVHLTIQSVFWLNHRGSTSAMCVCFHKLQHVATHHDSITDRDKRFFATPKVQTDSGAHPASYSMELAGSFTRGKRARTWNYPLTSI